MARVIVIASGKGGVGKTTIAANLGIALSLHKENVVVLDLDLAMANLELILGLEDIPVTLQEVLSGRDNIYNAIYEGPGGVKIVPAGLSLYGLKDIKLEKLVDVMETLVKDIDLLLIDAPGGLERDAFAALKVANELILVTTPEITALSDTLKTKIVANKLGLNILGVIINKNLQNNGCLSASEIESTLNVPVLSIIPDDSNLNFSSNSGSSIIINDPHSTTSRLFIDLAAKITGKYDYKDDLISRKIIPRFLEGIYNKINIFRSHQ